MNDRNPLIYVIGALLACLVCISVFVGDGNLLANLFFYLMIGGGILAIVSPKAGFILCLISCFYVDLVKRLMVVSDRVQMQDLYYVLGFPPLVFSIPYSSHSSCGEWWETRLIRWNLMMFVVACIIALINTTLSLFQGDAGIGRALQDAANGGLYAMILFVVPLLYPKADDVLRLFKALLWIFVPVAIYGVVQQVWGFREFELLYLQTGLSIEAKQLLTDRVRAFSTLNSPTSLGAIAALMMVASSWPPHGGLAAVSIFRFPWRCSTRGCSPPLSRLPPADPGSSSSLCVLQVYGASAAVWGLRSIIS